MSDITFDSIESSPASTPETEAGVEHVPAIDQDKLETPSDHIGTDDGKQTSKDKDVDKPKEDPKPDNSDESDDGEEGDPEVKQLVSFNGEEYDLKALLEDEKMFGNFSQQLKDSELRRADYSKKTADLAREREQFETESKQYYDNIHGYLDELDTVFNETPRLFLGKLLGVDKEGNMLPPEEAEQKIHDWVKKLSGELKMGAEYNPSQLKKQYDMESRIRRMEQEKSSEAERKQKEQYEADVSKLKDHIVSKATPNFGEDSPVSTLISKLPWMQEKLTEIAVSKFYEKYSAEHVKDDPSWDDYKFVDNFDFNKIFAEIEKEISSAYDNSYDKYLERKKAGAKKKPTTSATKNAGKTIEKSTTFDDLFKF